LGELTAEDLPKIILKAERNSEEQLKFVRLLQWLQPQLRGRKVRDAVKHERLQAFCKRIGLEKEAEEKELVTTA
jgi:hypothetical protein